MSLVSTPIATDTGILPNITEISNVTNVPNLLDELKYPTPFTVSPLLPLLLLSLATQKNAPDLKSVFKEEYDFVVVGAGAAGSVVASRLSEIPEVSVLLLEAGKKPPLQSEVPFSSRFFWNTDIDWNYNTVPQKYTGRSLINGEVRFPAGKGLGGSTLINAMLFVRGNKKDYDRWEKLGAKDWSYKEVLPYFKKMEDNKYIKEYDSAYHGVGGPLTIEKPQYVSELTEPLKEAVQELGYSFVDPNGKRQTGFYDIEVTTRNRQRCSTAKAYLVPAENRTNMDVIANALVTKVNIENGKATGVYFEFEGRNHYVRAKREVILSAGAFNSPQILMLSGIGPKEELEKHKIQVIADLPVGQNFQDHIGAHVDFLLDITIPKAEIKVTNQLNVQEYIDKRTGLLSSAEFILTMAFLRNLDPQPVKDIPTGQLYIGEYSPVIAVPNFWIRPDVVAKLYTPYEGYPMYTCLTHLSHPRSRGNVTLKSADPHDPPLIDPNYLAHHCDVKAIINAMKVCVKIGNTTAMKKIGSTRLPTRYPGCEEYADDDDKYFECQLKQMVITFSHQSGTAKMGDPKDKSTVVDPQLRVKGIENLRVVDASVMPLVTRGNTMAPTIMIAEKASDMIKEDYSKLN